MVVNEEVRALKRKRHEVRESCRDGSATGYGGGSEVQRQQEQMTTIVANKIHDVFDRLASQSKRRDLLIVDLQHKLHSIEEVPT